MERPDENVHHAVIMRSLYAVVVLASAGCNINALLAREDAGPSASATAATATTTPPAASASASASASAAPVAKNAKPAASAAASAAKKANVPTCKSGDVLVTLAMSPFVPVCATKCKTDDDCKVERCLECAPLDENGKLTNAPLVKVCDADYAKPPKCKDGEWLDDVGNKCRPLGQCAPNSPGYVWDEQKKKCVYKSKL